MIHPDTQLRYISDTIGYGVFATAFIPKGTIVYVKDSLEIELTPEAYLAQDEPMRAVTEKYSYIDERGVRIISWDFAKYVNHCCDCNTMSTGYEFEIAIKDIFPGDEITDEYGLFNFDYDMPLQCAKPDCRCVVSGNDLDRYYPKWDEKIIESLNLLRSVPQPLVHLIAPDVKAQVKEYLHNPANYRSVRQLRWHQPVPVGANGRH